MTYQEDRELFGKALLEGLYRKYESELASCEPCEPPSPAFYANMSKILGRRVEGDVTPPTPQVIERTGVGRSRVRKWWIAALVAAALLLAGCTAYVYREEISGFIQYVYDEYIKVVSDHDGEPQEEATLLEAYELTYIPEGYELVNLIKEKYFVQYCSENKEGEYLLFEQSKKENFLLGYDLNNESDSVIQDLANVVYYHNDKNHSYLWSDGVYSMRLVSSIPLSEQELAAIINGIRPVQGE